MSVLLAAGSGPARAAGSEPAYEQEQARRVVELVNAAQPSLEGKNLVDLEDLKGKALVRDSIDAATKHGDAWVEYWWYRPGNNTPARKAAYVRTVKSGPDTYILGSGYYLEE